MSDIPKNKVHIALDDKPEHAAALGRILGHWAVLEQFLAILMQYLLATDYHKTDIVYKEIVSIKAKISFLKRINHHFTKDDQLRIEINDLLSHVDKLNTKRNSFIHASWASDATNLYRHENILASKYTNLYKTALPFTPKDIQNVVEEIAELSASFVDLLFFRPKALLSEP